MYLINCPVIVCKDSSKKVVSDGQELIRIFKNIHQGHVIAYEVNGKMQLESVRKKTRVL